MDANEVSRNYAANLLRLPVADLTDELYEAYKEYLLTKRAAKALTQAMKGLNHVD